MTEPSHQRLAPSWFHALVGTTAVVAGFAMRDAGVKDDLVIVGGVLYAAWTAGRTVGVLLAVMGGLIELVIRAPAENALASSVPWLLLYITVALVTAGIETATRPTAVNRAAIGPCRSAARGRDGEHSSRA